MLAHPRFIQNAGVNNGRSNTAFFPIYPLCAWLVVRLSGLSIDAALLVTANVFLFAALAVFAVYIDGRQMSVGKVRWQLFAVASLAVFPTTFFFRMAYAESLFLLVVLLAWLSMARKWPAHRVAFLAGLATAVRPVGVAVLLPVGLYLWQTANTRAEALCRMLWLPVASWGLLAWMTFQWVQFDEPLAFARTQAFWRYRQPVSTTDKLVDLALYEPIWSTYVPTSATHWRLQGAQPNPLFSLPFANPIYFVGVAVLIVVGAWKHWLTGTETLLSVGLLGIPYLTRAHEMCMASHGRFAAVVFPAYIVAGHLLSRLPPALAAVILAFSAFLMAAYTVQFAMGYNLI